MSFLRVLYLLLLSLVLAVLATIFFVAPEIVSGWAGRASELGPITRFALAVVINLVLLILFILSVRPSRKTNTTGLIMRASGAITEVSVESARERILKAVNDVPDVIEADAKVKPVYGKADIDLQVVVLGQDVKLPAKQSEINRALKQVINKQLGLQMAGQPRVQIRLQSEARRPISTFTPPTPAVPIDKPAPFVPSRSVEIAPKPLEEKDQMPTMNQSPANGTPKLDSDLPPKPEN